MMATLTIQRGEEALTVEIEAGEVVVALSESGQAVQLTRGELTEAFKRWAAGEDETGR